MAQQQGDRRSDDAHRLAYESPKQPVGHHGSLVYLRDDDGGLTVTGPHSDALERWPRVKRGLAIVLGVGMFMAMIGAGLGGLKIDITRRSIDIHGNLLARAGLYVTIISAVALLIVWLAARTKRARVTIEANRDGVTYRVAPVDGPERVEHWAADEITGVGAGADRGVVLALKDGRFVTLHLGRHYVEWMRLADDVNRSLGRPVAELAPGEKQRMRWG